MDWVSSVLKSPEVLMGVVGAVAGLVALSFRGVKAKFTEEIVAVINEKFDAHEKLEGAHDDLVAQSIVTLQTDMSEMKDDVKALSRLQGYEQEEYTHLAVAAAIASGRADCGLGIAAAAQALDLDFVPLFEERYDLVIPKMHAGGPLLAPIYDVLSDPHYRELVESLPGYDASEMGEVIAEIE